MNPSSLDDGLLDCVLQTSTALTRLGTDCFLLLENYSQTEHNTTVHWYSYYITIKAYTLKMNC